MALRAVVKVAMRIALRADDPTAGIRIKTRDRGGWRTWTEDEIAQFEAAHPIGTRARLAFALLLYTGQRRGDVIRMGRQHIKDGVLTVHQAKTGVAVAIRSAAYGHRCDRGHKGRPAKEEPRHGFTGRAA